jgi:hypothetical protein
MVAPGFEIRFLRRVVNPPYPVKVHLPPLKGDGKPESEARLVGPDLDIVPPTSDDRHILLGRFLDAWGRLEGTITYVAEALMECDHFTAERAVIAGGMRGAREMLVSLAQMKLNAKHRTALINLTERLSGLTTKRNYMVHGHWVLEAIAYMKRGEVHLGLEFVREYSPADPDAMKRMVDPRNQKERVKYLFNKTRIQAAIDHVETLNSDLQDFAQRMRFARGWPKRRKGLLRPRRRPRRQV